MRSGERGFGRVLLLDVDMAAVRTHAGYGGIEGGFDGEGQVEDGVAGPELVEEGAAEWGIAGKAVAGGGFVEDLPAGYRQAGMAHLVVYSGRPGADVLGLQHSSFDVRAWLWPAWVLVVEEPQPPA